MLRRLTISGLVTGGLVSGALACGAFFDPDALGDGAGEPDAAEAGAQREAEPPPLPAEASVAEASVPTGCPTREGPSMVRIDDFCIDSTEVTRGQYARFVNAVGADAGGPDLPQCASNLSLEPIDPSTERPVPPPESPAFPVRGIDWCDAKAYCLWAGKNLCGGLGDTTLAAGEVTDPKKSQWAKACSKDGAQRFAYGDSYVGGRCIDGDRPTSPFNKSCEGGYTGLFDMVGNVEEWIDACKPPIGPNAGCALMGRVPGGDEIASCTTTAAPPANIPWQGAGVRCCAAPLK